MITQEGIDKDSVKGLRIYNCPNLTNISLPISDWGHLESIIIDDLTLTPGTYSSSKYNPTIWSALLEGIKAIGIAENSKLHTLKLDSLVGVGNIVLLDTSTGKGCPSLVEVSFKKLVSAGNRLLYKCTNLRSVSLPELETAGNSLLDGCTNLRSVSLPKLETAGYGLLYDCGNLRSVSLPKLETVSSGSCGLLESCKLLEEVSLPKLTSGGDYLLYSCPNLKRVYFGAAEITWGSNAFSGVTTSGVDLYLPDEVVTTDLQSSKEWKEFSWQSINKYSTW
jgi:hypothetical protein